MMLGCSARLLPRDRCDEAALWRDAGLRWLSGRTSRRACRRPTRLRAAPLRASSQPASWPTTAGSGNVELPCFMDDFEACIAHLRFPGTHRRAIRTTNLLERLFVEERRRLKIIPNAFGERAVLKLMFGALIRAAERRRSVKVTEFERKRTRSGIRGYGRPQREAPKG